MTGDTDPDDRGGFDADDLSARTEERDRDAEGFESGRSRRERRREDKRISSLLADRHKDRAENAALRRQLAEFEAERAKGRVSAIDADLAAAEAEARDGFADGDAEKAAKANRKLAELAAEKKAAQLEEEQADRAAKSSGGNEPDPESKAWIERNSGWFNKDQKKTRLALLAHQEATEVEGLKPATPEYFEFIEGKVEDKFPGTVVRDDDDEEDEEEEPPARTERRPAQGAAPVTRGARPDASTRRGGRTIHATADQVEMAKVAGVTVQEYMASAAELKRTGQTVRGRR